MQHIPQQYMLAYKWQHCTKQNCYFFVFIIYLAGTYERAIQQTVKIQPPCRRQSSTRFSVFRATLRIGSHSLVATVSSVVWVSSSQRRMLTEFPREIPTEIIQVVSGDQGGQIQLSTMQLPRNFCNKVVSVIVAPACSIQQPFNPFQQINELAQKLCCLPYTGIIPPKFCYQSIYCCLALKLSLIRISRR
jgi:hypothetical protein